MTDEPYHPREREDDSTSDSDDEQNYTLAEARDILTDDIRAMLHEYDNVTGTGIGLKRRNGKIIDRETPHIIVHVEAKKAVSKLPEEHVIPREIRGIPTDVVVTDIVIEENPRSERFRPVVGGIGGGHPDITSATIGSPVIDHPDGTRVMLTNNHAANPDESSSIGDDFLQPGASYGGSAPDDVIGTVYELGKRDASASDNCDTALIAINSDIQSDYMWGAGQFAGFEDADFNTRYIKFGNASGLTSGMLEEVDANMIATASDGTEYEYTGVERYERFHQNGDSGSLNCRIDPETGDVYGVSLHFAGSEQNDQSWAIPWSMIREEHGELTSARN